MKSKLSLKLRLINNLIALRMSGFFLSIFFCFGFTCTIGANCAAVTTQNKTIALPRLNPEKIALKTLHYQKIAHKSKRFRQAVYVVGAGTTVSVLAYVMYTLFKKEEDTKQQKKSADVSANSGSSQKKKDVNASADSSSSDKKSMQNVPGLSFVDKMKFLRAYKKELQNEGLWDLCKYNFKEGLTDWVYYAPITILMTSLLGISSSLLYVMQNKFLQLWNGRDKEYFLHGKKRMGLALHQLRSFFDVEEIFVNKEEISDMYFIFIDAVENLLALTNQRLQEYVESSDFNQNMYQSMIGAQKLLFDNVETFSDELEQKLHESEDMFLKQESMDSLFSSFKHINNQSIRFIGIFNAVCYDNNQ